MIVGIDGNEANVENRVGVNTYAYEILRTIHKLQAEWESKHKLIVYLKNKPLADMPQESKNFRYKVLNGRRLWILTKLMPRLFLNPERIEVLFSPSHYTVPISGIARVCAIMDLGFVEFSGQFRKKDFWQLRLWSAISVIVSKSIITISKSSQSDIVRHYQISGDKVHVVYPGYDAIKFNSKISETDVRRILNRYSIVDDYILYLGTLKPSKNIEGLIEAFALVADRHPKVTLVIAGKKGWLYDSIYERAENLGLSERILFTGFVREQDKPELIKGARVFVLPSFWEGFGLDILSAFGCGTPVVSSNAGSLPEVVGDAGILVDPKNTKAIADGIEGVLSMGKDEYNKLTEKGFRQAKKFSWEKCAREVLKILTNER